MNGRDTKDTGEMALNRQLLLGRLENEVATVNKRSDYRGTFRRQILELRPGNIKFLLLVCLSSVTSFASSTPWISVEF